MRAVIQRVARASVVIDDTPHAAIGRGLLVLLAVETVDVPEDAVWLGGKIARLRIFPDEAGLMNRSVSDAGGGVLVVSQFTLFASTRQGNRPSFTRSARPETAIPLYERLVAELEAALGRPVSTGRFGAVMRVDLLNDGPVTLILDSKLRE